MNGLSLGMIVEGSVAILLLTTIGYCVLLNARLKRLHADRGALKQMVTDLVSATNLANSAIGQLKETAAEVDGTLSNRLEEAERFAVQLANHVTSGQAVLQRISKITEASRAHERIAQEADTPVKRGMEALKRLKAHQDNRGEAA